MLSKKENPKKNIFVETRNLKKVIGNVRKAVDSNSWLVTMGDVGAGKTYLKDHLIEMWQSMPNKFVVINQHSFKNKNRVSIIMKRMIKEIKPSEHVPSDIESRYETLKTVLMQANHLKRKVILIFDESQDVDMDSLLELKKIHEISGLGHDHLFSIIMFGKDNALFHNKFVSDELGMRTSKIYMKMLEDKEVFEFTTAYGIKFESGSKGNPAKRAFLHSSKRKPLGVKRLCTIIKNNDKFKGTLTQEIFAETFGQSLSSQLKKEGISHSIIIKNILKLYGKSVSTTRVSDAINFKEESFNKTGNLIREVGEASLAESIEQKAGSKNAMARLNKSK